MTDAAIADPKLIALRFVALTSGEANDTTALISAWTDLAAALALAAPADPTVPADPDPQHLAPGAYRTIAGRRRVSADLCEAWLDVVYDVACLSVVLSSRPEVSNWAALHARANTLGAGGSALGTALILTGLTPDVTCDKELILRELSNEIDLAGLVGPATLSAGPRVWAVPPVDDGGAAYTAIVLADRSDDEAMGDAVWSPGLGPLARYLLNAAKMRYQARLLRDARHDLSAGRREIGRSLDRLRDLILDGNPTAAELADGMHELAVIRNQRAGLVDLLIKVRTMGRTTEIAASNMAALATFMAPADHDAGMFGADQATATAITQDLDDEAYYLEMAEHRARHIGDAIGDAVSRNDRTTADLSRARQQRFGLLQTAIIGTMLMALTVIQSIGYQIPIPSAAKLPTVALFASVAMWLSATAMRIGLASKDHNPTRTTAPERLAAACVAGCAIWLAAAVLSR